MISCYRNAQKNLFGHDIIDGLIDENAIEFREKCNCVPGCVSIKYDAEVDRTKFGFEEHLRIVTNSSTNTIFGSLTIIILNMANSTMNLMIQYD